MKEYIDYLIKSKFQYLATIGLDHKPKLRPFQFMFEHDGKLWFCTSNQKEVYRELQQNSSIELCASQEDMSWLRISAEVVFENHMEVKEKILEHSPLVKRIYREATNPNLEVFFLDKLSATISRIS
ncbi:pyridoxamine 5'-phosphate oxidase family protein [Marinifilum flexuosum]|uniref:Putative pyridoxamine 5'-phosphate oxidase family protein n=1 Tax=Marinifilum flexuosum TaxID=1117708 RepID=A0A419WSV4_9BACT|nr:pyridoxamine 5'-phosphate oxidase family protein [Marinifilum flexuosum]RKD98517.1 putative pyridoxamine 5'-phosphate oxidase family protein [Marinifilum flexuosum]